MNKLKEFVTKNKLYVGIGAGVIVALGVTAFLLSGGKDSNTPETSTVLETTSQVPETTVPDTTIDTTAPETTTEETTTTEAPTESTTVKETTTVVPETTTEATTKAPTTTVPETTTKNQSSSGKDEEETTEYINADGNVFYGYNSKRYQVLSTDFEPVKPEWEELPVMDDVFNFAIMDNNTWDFYMNNNYETLLYPELLPDLDNICLAWTKGQATREDIENVCHQNVCYGSINTTHTYYWLTTYTFQDLTVDTRTAGKPSHFVIYNYSEYFAEELQNSYDKWNSYFEEGNEYYNKGAARNSNVSHYLAIENMLVDGYVGIGDPAEYYYLKVYLDKKADRIHVYYVPFYKAYEFTSDSLTNEQIEEYYNLPENIRYNSDEYRYGDVFLRNIPEHNCKFINKQLED